MFTKGDQYSVTAESIQLFFELINVMAISKDEPVPSFYNENLLEFFVL